METLIRLALENFTLLLFVLGLLASSVSLLFRPRPHDASAWTEEFFSYFLLFSIGLGYFVNFVFHVFFGEMIAHFIGWADSPFQREVGFASLGFSAVGFLAFRGGFGLRLAAVTGPACFLWGAAGGHIWEIVKAGNFAPGNAGAILYTDIAFPFIGFALLFFSRKYPPKKNAGN